MTYKVAFPPLTLHSHMNHTTGTENNRQIQMFVRGKYTLPDTFMAFSMGELIPHFMHSKQSKGHAITATAC